jgi:hypothetical protein
LLQNDAQTHSFVAGVRLMAAPLRADRADEERYRVVLAEIERRRARVSALEARRGSRSTAAHVRLIRTIASLDCVFNSFELVDHARVDCELADALAKQPSKPRLRRIMGPPLPARGALRVGTLERCVWHRH